MKTFLEFMAEQNKLVTALNRALNPIRRAMGVETPPLPPGTKEVDYPELLKKYDTAMSGFVTDPGKKKPKGSTKIQDRVPEQLERDKPPKPQDSSYLPPQYSMMKKLSAMKKKINTPE
jgi:hypothetical protein